MDKEEYKIGTEEAGLKLGVSPRSVRRLAQQRVLDGHLQTTPTGKQWFFTEASLESLIKAREEQREKQKRHQTVKDTFGQNDGQPRKSEDDHGQPQTTEDMSKPDRPLSMSDEKRVEFLEKLLEQEQEEHTKTQGKLEKKETELLAEAKKASRLEGEKIGYEKMETQYRQLIAMFQDTIPKLQSSSAGDIFGRKSEDDHGQPQTTEDMSEPRPKSKRKKQTRKKSGETTQKKSTETPQKRQSRKQADGGGSNPQKKLKPPREAPQKEKNQKSKKSGVLRWLFSG